MEQACTKALGWLVRVSANPLLAVYVCTSSCSFAWNSMLDVDNPEFNPYHIHVHGKYSESIRYCWVQSSNNVRLTCGPGKVK